MPGFEHGHWLVLFGYLLMVNLSTFAMFGWDKRCARQSRERIPENRLLLASALGGTLGAKAGQRWFRHKTHKQPFGRNLNLVLALQLGLLCLVIWMGVEAPDAAATRPEG